jgi:hypothetical protein
MVNIVVHAWQGIAMHRLSGFADVRSKSLQMTKSLTHSMAGHLPNTITEMWEPSRDFVFFRLPTSGVRSVVALSGWVFLLLSLFLLSLSLLRGLSFVGCRYAIHT